MHRVNSWRRSLCHSYKDSVGFLTLSRNAIPVRNTRRFVGCGLSRCSKSADFDTTFGIRCCVGFRWASLFFSCIDSKFLPSLGQKGCLIRERVEKKKRHYNDPSVKGIVQWHSRQVERSPWGSTRFDEDSMGAMGRYHLPRILSINTMRIGRWHENGDIHDKRPVCLWGS